MQLFLQTKLTVKIITYFVIFIFDTIHLAQYLQLMDYKGEVAKIPPITSINTDEPNK